MNIAGSTTTGLNAISYISKQAAEIKDAVSGGMFFYSTCLASLWTVVGVTCLALASAFHIIAWDIVLPLGVAAGGAQVILISALNCLLGAGLRRQGAIILTAAEIARLLLALGFLGLNLSISWQVIALCASRLITVIGAAAIYRPIFRFRPSPLISRSFFVDGFQIQVAAVISLISTRIYDATIIAIKGTAQIALYGVATQISSQLLRIFESLRPLLMQVISSSAQVGARPRVMLLAGSSVLLCISILPLVLFSSPIVHLLYGPKYVALAAPALAISSVSAVTGILNYIVVMMLIADQRSRSVMANSLVQGGVGLAFALLLVPRFGTSGAATAFLLSQIAGLCFTAFTYFDAPRTRISVLALAITPVIMLGGIAVAGAILGTTTWIAVPVWLALIAASWLVGLRGAGEPAGHASV